ncbi:MAG: iron ABC transporter permease [Clostridiales bacterium]|nr:iron ABC transporter permease [Clostridiales bacterium]
MDEGSKRRLRYCVTLMILIILFAVFVLLNISIGSVAVNPKEIIAILFGAPVNTTEYGIIWKVRLPRASAAVILGGALALSGFLLQTFFNNPIAGPYVLGISSGAKLMVAVVMVMALSKRHSIGSGALIAAAFSGSIISIGFVLLAARVMRRPSTLIVSGVMIGYICSAITDFIVTFADDASIVNLHNWSRGSFSGASWKDVRTMAPVALAASITVFLMSKPIGAYQMGESYARNMGVNIVLFRGIIVALSSVLCACVTAFAGPVSFVGIAVPHLIKLFLKTSKPLLVIPACFLGGSVFCLGCDLIARTVFAPVEMSVSSVTAVLGAPIVIAVMLRKKARV